MYLTINFPQLKNYNKNNDIKKLLTQNMYHEIEQVLLSLSLLHTAEYCDIKMVLSLITNLNAANIFFLIYKLHKIWQNTTRQECFKFNRLQVNTNTTILYRYRIHSFLMLIY